MESGVRLRRWSPEMTTDDERETRGHGHSWPAIVLMTHSPLMHSLPMDPVAAIKFPRKKPYELALVARYRQAPIPA